MNRKIYVTASDMLALREQGLSNHDIAKSLDISHGTVLRYIGKQEERMESLEAFHDTPPKKKTEEPKVVTPIYEPKPVIECYEIGGVRAYLHSDTRCLSLQMPHSGEIRLKYDSVPDLVCFLAWAMRTRMEVTADADKLKTEGRTI